MRRPIVLGGIVATPLGDKIRKLRKAQKMSMETLAVEADMSKSYLWELENSDDANPTVDKLERLAAVLNTTAEHLVSNEQLDQPADAFDKAFFRNYKSLKPETKQQLLEILKTLKKPQG
jgi:transcriptional regulator with XRE-family HTH domain